MKLECPKCDKSATSLYPYNDTWTCKGCIPEQQMAVWKREYPLWNMTEAEKQAFLKQIDKN